jgi:hypothetical protein
MYRRRNELNTSSTTVLIRRRTRCIALIRSLSSIPALPKAFSPTLQLRNLVEWYALRTVGYVGIGRLKDKSITQGLSAIEAAHGCRFTSYEAFEHSPHFSEFCTIARGSRPREREINAVTQAHSSRFSLTHTHTPVR